MSSDISSQHDEGSTSSGADTPAADSDFELFDDGEVAQADELDNEMYWFAASDTTQPSGPVSIVEIRKRIAAGDLSTDSLVWCRDMPEWVPIADRFDIPTSAGIDDEIAQQPPSLPGSLKHSSVSDFLESVGTWNPTAYLVRVVARGFLAFGLLTMVVSLVLLPFGISWFSGGLQILLIATVLELIAAVRGLAPTKTAARAHATEQTEDQSFT